ncbi:conserved hypothetical protein [delta proteobacterium NaphS2]|nr:conserved hypothetical protein [delta proteobacterium NaphS2]
MESAKDRAGEWGGEKAWEAAEEGEADGVNAEKNEGLSNKVRRCYGFDCF